MEQEKATYTIRLGDGDIEAIINGGTISIEVSENVCVEIGQSLVKDNAMPIVNNDKKVFSEAQIRNIKLNTFKNQVGYKELYEEHFKKLIDLYYCEDIRKIEGLKREATKAWKRADERWGNDR